MAPKRAKKEELTKAMCIWIEPAFMLGESSYLMDQIN